MGSILCRGSLASTTALDDTDSATLLPRVSSQKHKIRTTRDNSDTFHPSHKRLSARDRHGQVSDEQRGHSVAFRRPSQAATSPGPSTGSLRAIPTKRISARRSLSPAATVSYNDPTMDDTVPLIDGKASTSSVNVTLSSSPKDENSGSVESHTTDRVAHHGNATLTSSSGAPPRRPRLETIDDGMYRSKPRSMKDKLAPSDPRRIPNSQRSRPWTRSAATQQDGKIQRAPGRGTRFPEKKRRASSSPVLLDSSNVQDLGTRPKAEAAPFFSDESSISTSSTSSILLDENTTRVAGNLEFSNEVIAAVPEKRAHVQHSVAKPDVKIGGSSVVFRPLPEPGSVAEHAKSGLRAGAPIFIPKPIQYPSMGYPNSFTQAHVHPFFQMNHQTLLHASQELQKTDANKIVRLQGHIDPRRSDLPVLPLLGMPDPSQPRTGAREMHHWSPTMSSAFQVPQFTSWQSQYDLSKTHRNADSDKKPAPLARPMERNQYAHADQPISIYIPPKPQRPALAATGSSATASEGKEKGVKHAVQAATRFARKDPQAIGGSAPVPGRAPASSLPRIFHHRGTKVTVIDEHRKVFVIDLLPKETCDLIRSLTNDHLVRVKASGDESRNWRTLYTYTKMDLPCNEVTSLPPVMARIMNDIIKIVGTIHGQRKAASKLRPRSWKEPHLLLYQRVKGKPVHTGVEMHYDGCDITWQVMLSDLSEYQGGGTYIRALRQTVKLRQGQVLVHPGELYHKGCDITGGTRLLIVGFMDGFDPKIIDDSSANTDSEEHEKNVRIY